MKEKDLLDNKIWIASQIEESKQELEGLIGKKINELEYEETIKKIHSSIEQLNKDIEQVDYNRTRSLESLEQDLTLKLDDVKVVEDNILKEKIKEISDDNIIEFKKSIAKLEEDFNKSLIKSLKEIREDQECKFSDFIDDVELKLENSGLNEKIEQNQQKEEKIEQLKNEVKILEIKQDTELLIVKEQMQQHKDDVDATIQNLNDEFNKVSQGKNVDINNLEELLIQKLEELKEENVGDLEEQKQELIKLILKSIDELEIDKIRQNDEFIIQKVSELESINQNKLEKLRKSQEQFIIEKVMELDSKKAIDQINKSMKKIDEDIQSTTALIENIKDQSLKEVKAYVESRILRMKYTMTIEALREEIGRLNLKIRQLEQKQLTDVVQIDIERIVEQKVKEEFEKMHIKEINAQVIAKKASSIDDLIEIRGEPIKNKNLIEESAKQIANVTKAVKKCQILNLDD